MRQSVLHTVAIIPARGGSKGIPRKNLQILGNKPLIAWPIELAKSISNIDRVIVSTDDHEIAAVAKKFGAEVPFIRPVHLSGDAVPTLPVLQHTLSHLESENYAVETVLLLYPTNPFLKRSRILEALQLLNNNSCKSVIGVREVHGLVWKQEESTKKFAPFYPKERVNRQLFTHLYEEAGNIYFSKASVLQQENKIVSENNCQFVFVEDDERIDIDTPEDLVRAQKKAEELHEKTF